jgi:Ca-activated chloride channel family protein
MPLIVWDSVGIINHSGKLQKKTIEEFSFFLQKNYNVEMGLRVYGHNSPVSANDCFDSKLEVPIEENSAKKIVAKLRTIQYKGTTPLTYSLEQAADDLGCNSKKNVIILITDGYETCNQNPCAMAEKLLDFRISIKPLIVGLNIDPKEIQHLHCIGDFKNARNKEDFKKELYNSFINIANRRSFSVYLKNGAKKISETNIPFTLYNAKK